MDLDPELLLAARIALGMTREELAEASGVGARTLEDLETYRKASIETYRKVRKALEELGVSFVGPEEGRGPGFHMPANWTSRGPSYITDRQVRRDLRKPKAGG